VPRIALLWYRRDLRPHDHPALHAALAAGDRVVPVHAPWTMPQGVQAAAGCVIGRDYPGPIDGGPARPAGQTHHAVKRCPKPFLPDWL
jgi:hypothetical protein